MKRTLSTILAVALLLGLGALAVLARGGGDILTPVRVAPVALAAAPDAPAAGPKYNAIALPLDTGLSLASELEAYIETSTGNTVSQILKWDPTQGAEGSYVIYEPGSPFSVDFGLRSAGDALFALMSGTSTTLSLVGDVPPERSVTFDLVGDPAGCHYNFISVPLDMGAIATAEDLALSIGDVVQALSWDAAQGDEGAYIIYEPGSPFSVDFDVEIGYPYFVCVSNATAKTWPVWP